MIRFFRKLLRRPRLDRELAQQLEFHRDMAAAGGNPTALGSELAIQEQVYDSWRLNFIENLWRDLSYTARGLWRSKGFTLSALLSLALGIGANTAIFSLAVEFLLSRPSLRNPSEIVYIRTAGGSHAEPRVFEFIQRSGAFAAVAGENDEVSINWNDGHETRRLFGVQCSRNYFAALGVPVALGRGWSETDPVEVAVLRHQFWRNRLHSDPAVLGRKLILNGRAYTVIGVLPEDHRTLTGVGFSPDLYVPVFIPNTDLAIHARLQPGMSLGEARAAANTLSARLNRELPGPRRYNAPPQVTPVGGFAKLQQDRKALTIAVFFGILLLLVGMVLLIACVNVAGMLLARASARRQEIAIRLSLGASRARLFQQLLAESTLLSLLGSALGLALSTALATAVSGIPMPLPIPITLRIDPDWRVTAYAALLAIGATIASGFAPAWQTLQESLAPSLQRERRLQLRRWLVVAQVAVSFVVLVTGALFLRSLMQSTGLSPGFDVRHTVRAEVHLPPELYRQPGRELDFSNRTVEALAAIPGVEAAAAARIIPFNDATNHGRDITFADNGEKRHIEYHWNAVTPDYFKAMSIPFVAGRPFNRTDGTSARIAIVNRVFAERFLSGRPPIGARFVMDENQTYEVIGIVEGTKVMTMGEDPQPQLYEPLAQLTGTRLKVHFVIRSATPPAGQLRAVREVLRQAEPGAGLVVETMFNSTGLALLPAQAGALLMGSTGLIGLLLAVIGLYGVLAYSVARRTREIGIRIAVGATARQIAALVLIDAGRMVATGSAIGIAIALLVTEPLSRFLVPGLSPKDPISFAAVAAVLALSALLATLGPLRRAAAIDPMKALRWE